MKLALYPRLAWMGLKKNARLYVPYLLSCAFMAAALYVIAGLASTPRSTWLTASRTAPAPPPLRW